MKIVVIGGTGLIGSKLVEKLREDGHQPLAASPDTGVDTITREGLAEAAEWARHFGHLEQEMDELLAHLFGVSPSLMHEWINPGRYVIGRELADAGMAELVEIDQLHRVPFARLLREPRKNAPPIIRPSAARRLRMAPAATSPKKPSPKKKSK